MMQANSMKTVMGGLALVLVLTASNQPAQSSDVVIDRDRVVPQDPTERTVPSDRLGSRDRTVSGTTFDRMTSATACSSHTDARGNIVYDDPTCPDRYRREHGELAAACSSYSSYVDPDGRLVYRDPNSPDRPSRPMASSADDVQPGANYDRQTDAALTHARKAEAAGDQGNIPEMVRHARLSLDQAIGSQRARTDANLNGAIMDLNETVIVGCRNNIAPAVLRDARAKLSRAAHGRTSEGIATGIGTTTVRGELFRDQSALSTGGGEHYILRDRQNRELPISLSPEMSRRVSVGDMVEAQIDSRGQVVAISKSE